jgi:hypothetical protein
MSITDLNPPSPRSRQLAPLIVIEGPAHTGRTTLARALAQAAAPAVLITARPHGDDPGRPKNEWVMRAYHMALVAQAQEYRARGIGVVMDGHWLGRVIDGCAAERLLPSRALTYRRWFGPLFTRLKAFYVFCLDEARVPGLHASSEEDALRVEQLRQYSLECDDRLAYGERVAPYLWRTNGATPEALERFAKLVLSLAMAPAAEPSKPSGPADLASPGALPT